MIFDYTSQGAWRWRPYNPLIRAGVLGLPPVGKRTLCSLPAGGSSPPPGGRPEARPGMARVPDPRGKRFASRARNTRSTTET